MMSWIACDDYSEKTNQMKKFINLKMHCLEKEIALLPLFMYTSSNTNNE